MFLPLPEEAALAARKMAQLRDKPHLPAQLLDLVQAVMALQAPALAEELARAESVPPPPLTPVDKVLQGASLMARQDFPVDFDRAAGLFEALTALLADLGGPSAQAASVVRQGGREMARRAMAAIIADENAPDGDGVLAAFARQVPQAPRGLRFLAQSALAPQLQAVARVVAANLPLRTWDQATCPLCGSLAFHSVLEGKEGRRTNVCSFCQASFRTVRLQCPYCQERDTKKLPFLTADEEPGYRLDTCLSCQGYIKTTDFREFDRPSLPALDDLESMALDILAVKRGFSRPTTSAWGF